ncbi:hemolysin type calcium-binding protein [Enterovirga rhinocerotis]|uniref:Hemolysin type calcium-binding protein n=1 Tax=Enterovirga rhinocerotis TaxID=1339210 RepID=A0A4R7CB34_9HYPH|nr:hemolysin type calcium-binding protein [Enterovirga rhinocerotis]
MFYESGGLSFDFSDNNRYVDILGGDFGDILTGGFGNDRLNGGLGADTMTGGAGNDIFVIDNVGDVVVELASEGIDQVRTTLDNYVLGANVENLFLMGTADLSGSGNTLDNVLQGNGGANTLWGGAGNDRLDGRAGADTLIGGTGDDTYYIDDLGDVIVEEAGEGYDTAMLGVDGYVLAYSVSVERLILRDGVTTATGNNLDNVLQGNGDDNVLFGGGGRDTLRGGAGNDTLIGGAGIDSLYGGAGADTFVLTATTPDRDMIRDFVAAEDMIEISASLFGGGLIAGDELTDQQFVLSTTGRATSATDRFLYVESKGHLYYDADGSGRDEAPQLIAVLTTTPPHRDAFRHRHLSGKRLSAFQAAAPWLPAPGLRAGPMVAPDRRLGLLGRPEGPRRAGRPRHGARGPQAAERHPSLRPGLARQIQAVVATLWRRGV